MGRNNPLAEILGKSLEDGPREPEEALLEGTPLIGSTAPPLLERRARNGQ